MALAFFAPSRIQAQAVGEIVGTVTDPSGAVVPNAKVTAAEQATGLTRSTVSTVVGSYTVAQLPVGTYTVTAEASGFKTATTKGITLDVSQQREVDFTLTLAGAQQTVEVTAAPPLLTSTNGALVGLVTGEQVQSLPLNGREITNLVMLQPGMNPETDGTGWLAPEWAGNGNRGQTEIATLDNIDASDAEMGNVQFWNFNLDAIAEFKVLQNNYSSEYGQGGGTIVQIVSKSGTNQLHGSAFEFNRNSVFNVRNFFSSTVPPFQRNEFGGTIGGPIKKDKTFFFGEYAGFRQRLGEPINAYVPTAQERQGIATFVCDPKAGCTGTPGVVQGTVTMNPIAQNILSRYPQPNQPGGVFGPNTFNTQFKIPRNNDQFSIRGDHTFSSADSMFIRASYINNKENETDPVAASENPLFAANLFNNPRNYAVTETHILSPTVLNTFSFGINREITGVTPGTQAFPQDSFTDNTLANFGPDTFITKYVVTQFIPQDKIIVTRGRHTLALGSQFRRVWDNGFGVSVGGPNGIYQFSPGITKLNAAIPIQGGGTLPAGASSPTSLVSFMEGLPSVYTRSTGMQGFSAPGNPSPYSVRVWHLNIFAQDDIKVTSRLTVNVGLRWEYNSVTTEAANRLDAIVDDPKFGGGNLFGHMILNPRPLYNPDYRGFGPRFGVAERLSNKTVLRGGFGVFTNVSPTVFPDQALVNFPYASFTSQTNPPFSATPLPVSGIPVLLSLSGQPMPPNGDTHKIPPNTPVNLTPIAAFFGGGNPAGGRLLTNLTSTSYKNGYTMAGNVTVERELSAGMGLQMSYAMNNAVGLYSSEWPNGYTGALPQYAPYTAVDQGIGEFQLTDNHAHSTYNALQVQLRRLPGERSFQFQVSYTYSKTIDNASTVWNGFSSSNSGTQPSNPLCYACEKSRSGFDFPQRVVVNFGYRLPFNRWQSVPKRLSEGWQVMSILSAQSGFPFTVNSPLGTVPFGTDTYTGFQPTRPNQLTPAPLSTAGGPNFFTDAVLNATTQSQFFATPTEPVTGLQTAPGNLGRNTFRTHSFSNADFSIVKDTRITEEKLLQFRAEFFNLFNQHAFSVPGQVLTSGQFGVASATVLPERQIQFGLRFIF